MTFKPRLSTLKACALASVATIAISTGTAFAQAGQTVEFDIEAQDLSRALTEFGVQSRTEVLFNGADVRGISTDGLSGTYSADQAIKLLLDDTGIDYRQNADGTLLVGRVVIAEQEQESSRSEEQAPAPFRVAEVDQEVPVGGLREPGPEDEVSVQDKIVVTGSNIRGVETASPLVQLSRDEIDLRGAATAQDLMRTLSQNFGGGVSEFSNVGVTVANDAARGSIGASSGVNLRGLGTDSTLVLLNGRRLAPSGGATHTDVSLIPLSAIARVDVLTDGASAIYGSDAVGGVVNFVLREDFHGAETRARLGAASDGNAVEVQLGQTVGASWGSGSGLAAYEYYERAPGLEASDRGFTAGAPGPVSLLPEQRRHSLFLSMNQQASESIDVFGTFFYGDREARSFFTAYLGPGAVFPRQLQSDAEQLNSAIGAGFSLPNDWRLEVSTSFAKTKEERDDFDIVGGVTSPVLPAVSPYESESWAAETLLDGALWQMPGGEVRVAFGGQYREESYFHAIEGRSDDDQSRDVKAVFSELVVPMVGVGNRLPGVERLELSGALRYEEYSDFGGTTDPKLGVLWSPVSGVNVRGTYGTSFRAPLFLELSENFAQSFTFYAPDPRDPDFTGMIDPSNPSGSSLVSVLLGGNSSLAPEEAETLTLGFDFEPELIEGVSFSATYFEIDFNNRISEVIAFFDALTNPTYAPLLDFDPDQNLLGSYALLPDSLNFTSADPSSADVLVDARQRNLSSSRTRGLDFGFQYSRDLSAGTIGLSIDGTYLLENDYQILSSVAPVESLNTVSNPIDLRFRAGASFSDAQFDASLFVNYVDDYRDTRTEPGSNIDSWVTVDLNMKYAFETGPFAWLNDTDLVLNVSNLLDEDPPFVDGFLPGLDLNYDSDNANPVGRVVSLQLTKRW